MADYIEHEIAGGVGTENGPATGCSFRGFACLFVARGEQNEIGETIAVVRCTRVKALSASAIQVVDSSIVNSKQYFSGHHTIAACVHRSVLYVFFTSGANELGYARSTDGKTWTGPYPIPHSATLEVRRQLAAISVGEHVIVLAPVAGDGVRAYVTAKFETWEERNVAEVTNVHNLAACTFQGQSGALQVMVAGTPPEWGVKTYYFSYSPEAPYLHHYGYDFHSDFSKESEYVALAAGSVTNGRTGSIVQLIANGWHGPTWFGAKQQQMREYRVDGGGWGPVKTLTEGYTRHTLWRHFGAFSHVRPISESELRQEVWYVFNYNHAGTWLYATRWQSDQLKRVDTKNEPVSDGFRSLMAVVEGPPPYVLNGATSLARSSVLHLGMSSSDGDSVAATFQFGAFLTIGGKAGLVDTALQLGRDLIEGSQQETERKRTFDKAIRPLPLHNEVMYVYLRPVVKRHDYELRDWSGAAIPGIRAYAFELDDKASFSVDYEPAAILDTFPGKPNTHDFKSWLRRLPATPDYAQEVLNTELTWLRGGDSSFTFAEKTSELTSRQETVKAELKTGVDKIFDMGGNSTFTYAVTKKTATTKTIKVVLDYPEPRPNEPNDIAKVRLQIRVWLPNPQKIEQCYWIPEHARGQRPWVVVWSVTEFKTVAELDAEED